MKYLKTYKLFESRFVEFREVVDTIKDICPEFEDHNCHCEIEPKDDIKLNLVSLKSRGHISSIKQKFYLDIDIDRRICFDEKRSGMGPFPEWFIETCKRIEDYMSDNGFKTKPAIKYPTDYENLESVDELNYAIGLIDQVRLDFIPTAKPLDESVSTEDLDYNLIQEIKDILLPFSDMDMKVSCDYTSKGDSIALNVMTLKEKAFDINEYKDDIDRLLYYMKDNNWGIWKFNLGVVEKHEGKTHLFARNQDALSYKNGPIQYDKVKNPVFWITAEFVKIVYTKVKSIK